MKMKLGMMTAILTAMVLIGGAFALDWTDVNVESMIQPQATINPVTNYQNTFSIDTTGISWQSCNIKANYQLGVCDYLYKCYIILPQDCTTLECAKQLACDNSTVAGVTTRISSDGSIYTNSVPGTGMVALVNPVTLTVKYAPTTADIGKTYGVAALIMKSHMTYDWATQAWTDYTTPVDGTMQYDSITIEGAVQPDVVDITKGFTAAIANLVNAIKAWFCTSFGIWC
jgi:hypothetical protein